MCFACVLQLRARVSRVLYLFFMCAPVFGIFALVFAHVLRAFRVFRMCTRVFGVRAQVLHVLRVFLMCSYGCSYVRHV